MGVQAVTGRDLLEKQESEISARLLPVSVQRAATVIRGRGSVTQHQGPARPLQQHNRSRLVPAKK